MSHGGLTSDDFAENMELQSVLKAVRLPADFDPYRVIRVPSEDKTQDTESVTFRTPKLYNRRMEQLYGHGRRYRNRTEFINHYIAIGFYIERELSPEDDALRSMLDTVLAQTELNSQITYVTAIDDVVEKCRIGLDPKTGDAEGDLRQNMIIQLNRMKRICESNGYSERVKGIDDILHRSDS